MFMRFLGGGVGHSKSVRATALLDIIKVPPSNLQPENLDADAEKLEHV